MRQDNYDELTEQRLSPDPTNSYNECPIAPGGRRIGFAAMESFISYFHVPALYIKTPKFKAC